MIIIIILGIVYRVDIVSLLSRIALEMACVLVVVFDVATQLQMEMKQT